MTNATYGEGTNLSTNQNRFNEQVTAYGKNGNQLKKVKDNAMQAAHADAESDFKNDTDVELEYEYDYNGRLTKDLNKNISKIKYNSLDLPSSVSSLDVLKRK